MSDVQQHRIADMPDVTSNVADVERRISGANLHPRNTKQLPYTVGLGDPRVRNARVEPAESVHMDKSGGRTPDLGRPVVPRIVSRQRTERAGNHAVTLVSAERI